MRNIGVGVKEFLVVQIDGNVVTQEEIRVRVELGG